MKSVHFVNRIGTSLRKTEKIDKRKGWLVTETTKSGSYSETKLYEINSLLFYIGNIARKSNSISIKYL